MMATANNIPPSPEVRPLPLGTAKLTEDAPYFCAHFFKLLRAPNQRNAPCRRRASVNDACACGRFPQADPPPRYLHSSTQLMTRNFFGIETPAPTFCLAVISP